MLLQKLVSHHILINDINRKCVRNIHWDVQLQKLVHLTSCLHVPTKYVASSSLLPSLSLDSKGTRTVVPCRTHTSCVAINFFYVGNLAYTLGIHATLSLLSEQTAEVWLQRMKTEASVNKNIHDACKDTIN